MIRKQKILDLLIDFNWAYLANNGDTEINKDSFAEAIFPDNECSFDILEFLAGLKARF